MARQAIFPRFPELIFVGETGVRQSNLVGVFLDETAALASLSVAPASGAVSITGFAPGGGFDVAPPAGAVSITGFAPSGGFDVAPPAGAVSITGFAPSGDVGMAPGAGAFTFTGYAPAPLALSLGGPMITIIV